MSEALAPIISKIFISPGHDFKNRKGLGRLRHEWHEVPSVECVAGSGLVGDRYFDFKEDYKGQITFIDRAVIDEITATLNIEGLDDFAFRRNVVIAGLDLNALIGKTFELDGVQLTGSEECAPCIWMDDEVAQGAWDMMKGRGGLRCRIRTSGTLSTGQVSFKPID